MVNLPPMARILPFSRSRRWRLLSSRTLLMLFKLGSVGQYLRWMGQALHQQTATLDLPNPHRNMTCPAPWFASPMAIP